MNLFPYMQLMSL